MRLIVAPGGFHDYEGDGKYYGETNITGDKVASQTVLENLRCVIVPFRDFNAQGIAQTRSPWTPRWRVEQMRSDPLRGLMLGIYVYPWAHYVADGGPTATLLSTNYAAASKQRPLGQRRRRPLPGRRRLERRHPGHAGKRRSDH